MRYSSNHKAETRQKLLSAAAEVIRAEGPSHVSVGSLMSTIGMTHGGFYAHFSSKDELVCQAIKEMFRQTSARFLLETEGKPARVALSRWLNFYLSPEHRDAPGAGCPMAALLVDAARLPMEARNEFSRGVRQLRAQLADLLARLGYPRADRIAGSLQSEMLGALTLARAEPNASRSDRLLKEARATLQRRFAPVALVDATLSR